MNTILHISTVHGRYDTRILLKECLSLKKSGYNVFLLVVDCMEDETFEGVKIQNLNSKRNTISRFRRMLLFPIVAFRRIIIIKPSVVHFHDPELMLLGLWLRFFGFKVIYDIHDELDEQILHKTYLPVYLRTVLSRALYFFEQFTAKFMSGIVVVNDKMQKKYWRLWEKNRVVIVENFPVFLDTYFNDSMIQDDVGFVFLGNISKARGLEKVLKLNQNLEKPLKFRVIGPVQDPEYQRALSPLLSSKGVDYLGRKENREAQTLIRGAIAGLLIYDPLPNYIQTFPVKMFEYLINGIPLIASNFELWKQFVDKYNCGIVVDPNDNNSIVEALLYAFYHKEEMRTMGMNGMKAVQSFYSWSFSEKKLIAFYKNIEDEKN